jgi:hypothetical protein
VNAARMTGYHPRDVERLELGELVAWTTAQRRAEARRRAKR